MNILKWYPGNGAAGLFLVVISYSTLNPQFFKIFSSCFCEYNISIGCLTEIAVFFLIVIFRYILLKINCASSNGFSTLPMIFIVTSR